MTMVEKKKPQPIVKSNKTQTYDLYETASLGLVRALKERHTVVVADLKMWVKEPNLTNVMENRKITFVGELANIGNINIYPSASVIPKSIVKEWILNERTPPPPQSVSKSQN